MKDVCIKNNNHLLNLNVNKNLLKKIDKFKEENGFSTRTNAIRHLLLIALKEEGY